MDPRVFKVYNFFSEEESDHLVKKAIAETSETHKIKRSTTGAGENTVFSKITSESGFDTHGEIAQKVKRCCMMSCSRPMLQYILRLATVLSLLYMHIRCV
jgi:hypothetical protein